MCDWLLCHVVESGITGSVGSGPGPGNDDWDKHFHSPVKGGGQTDKHTVGRARASRSLYFNCLVPPSNSETMKFVTDVILDGIGYRVIGVYIT